MGYLYKLDFTSGKSYVGITNLPSVSRRLALHRCSANKGGKLAVHQAWQKHGEPRVTVLAVAAGDFLLELERRAVIAYQTYGACGYNMTPGGDINPACTPESRAKIAAASRGRKASALTRERMSFAHKGKPKSQEWRDRIAASHIGMKASDDTKAKLSAIAKARVATPETRVKLSAVRRGRKLTPEHCAKIAAAKLGTKHSPATIAKLTGRVFSATHCANISAAKRRPT